MEIAVLALVPIFAAIAAGTWILWKILKGVGHVLGFLFQFLGEVLGRVGGFLRSELVEGIQLAGALLTFPFLIALTLLNFVIGRWQASSHYARAMKDEVASSALGVYRIGIGHPLRFFGLSGLLEGLERRLPDVVERAPRRPRPADVMRFEGYDVVGTLPPGGSGAQLFLARPRREAFERLARSGATVPSDVVIKSFALQSGSTLPQIIRESRALEAAKRLGLVLEHHLETDRFYYVMEYVRGDDLGLETQRMHQRSGPEGLRARDLQLAVGFAMDVLRSLDRFHSGGLWHKDVKPANVIVSEGRAHLVDFGLVTSLSSSLTLTTHGTEYYRDPEMVRLAMRGVKVHEVDGVKFDLYSMGAMLYSMIENSFPAHGSLSRISKRCPEVLAWIVRRSMADVGSRYGSANEMLRDLEAVASAVAPEQLRPADLPSVRGDMPGAAPGDEPPIAEPIAVEEPEVVTSRFTRAGKGSPVELLAERRDCRSPRIRRRGGSPLRRLFVAGVAVAFVAVPMGLALLFVTPGGAVARRSERLRPAAYAAGTGMSSVGGSAVEVSTSSPGQALSVVVNENVAQNPPQYPGLEGARALVLDDLTHGAGRAVVSREEGRLVSAGARILDPGSTNLFGDVRNAIGVGTQGDQDARDRLQDFLDASPDLDVILWVADGLAPALFTRKGFRVD